MCLGIVGRVLEIKENRIAVVDVNGVQIEADASFIDIDVGDNVIVHAGVVISKVDKKEAEIAMSLKQKLIEEVEKSLL